MKSMTGYGRGCVEENGFSVQVELRSVNNRFFSMRTRMPESFLRFETAIESTLKKYLGRGSVTCQVQYKQTDSLAGVSQQTILSTFQELSEFTKKNEIPGDVNLSLLFSLPRLFENGKINEQDSEKLQIGLMNALSVAVDQLILMREKEGSQLQKHLQDLNVQLSDDVKKITQLAEGLVPKQQDKLKRRVKVLLDDQEFDEITLARELSLIADRSDISEELARLHSHLIQFGETMGQFGPVGRKLDFLLQEINREINTIGSKSTEVELSQLVVTLKSIVEQIREQVQNVE